MKVSIVIPVYRDPKIHRCLRSLKNSAYKDIEIISMVDWDKEGPAVIRNRGAKKATGDVLFFIDSDATVYSNTLNKIAERMKDLSIDGVSIIWDNKPLEQDFFSKFKAIEINHLMTDVFPRWCGSNGTAIRKSIFEEFDESYKEAGAEDFEWGLRLLAKYNIVPARDILMQHSFNGITKYFRRAFQRGKVLVNTKVRSGYNSSNFIRMLFSFALCKKFYKAYGLWFCIRATLLHRFYMLAVIISGGLGYVYATLSNLLRNR